MDLGVAPDIAKGSADPIQDAYISQASPILVGYYLNVNCITCNESRPRGQSHGAHFFVEYLDVLRLNKGK